MGLSSFASKPIEAIVEANPQTFFQMYWMGTRERMVALMDRARSAGAKGLIVTLDWTFAHRRDWGSPQIPDRLDLRAMAKFAPQAIARPRWLVDFVRNGGVPDLITPNLAPPGEDAPTFFGAYGEWMQTPLPTWSDIAWLREQWAGPFLIKGVMHPDDARHAVEIGADAISVSNHGGNNLDGTPASIRALPAVVEAVGGRIEIVLDGGIRRGSDVVKALALGARAVMIGRAYLWGLAARGEAGVDNVLQILRSGIDETLVGLGRASIRDLAPEDVIVRPDFVPARLAKLGEAASPLTAA
jgi:L-lactate dehydrogenase (cytochrome)